ncbi:hypothetical protein H2248_003999 [Termitomyces sp. 'cryptogamus']|nr:hypothetical protein H2248_003999 [Termitomyces sp. 'cryptogamus']
MTTSSVLSNMPAKYSHIKKRTASGLRRKNGTVVPAKDAQVPHRDHHGRPSPHTDRSISRAISAVAQLEQCIARLLLLRYEQDIARLYSTRLYNVALIHLPTLVMRCIALGGPGWLVHNSDSADIKDFFRAAIGMDMRQAGERVATKSVFWSYTALRHFAMSNNVPICAKKGLHSLRLLECYRALKVHIDVLETMPPPSFSKPPHLGSLQEGQEALEDACELKYGDESGNGWDNNWRAKVQLGYERLVQTLWRVAREFDVRGYSNVLREKLISKWCDCGCCSDHLGEVCERTVRNEEAENVSGNGSRVRVGKQREWDGRGSGVYGWETLEEEDVWEVSLDFVGSEIQDEGGMVMTVGEVVEWRFYKAEREKEMGNTAFRQGDFQKAIDYYTTAHEIEPELPHYQLNIAAAYLKLQSWIEAEAACTKALSQHRSSKGYYRRARSRRMLGRPDEAIRDLRAALKLQPTNTEALIELQSLAPPSPRTPSSSSSASTSSSSLSSSSSFSSQYSSSSFSSPLLTKTSTPPTTQSKKYKHPPWPRTKSDERRLKIVLFPASLEDFARECLCESVGCPHHLHLRDHDHEGGAENGGKKKRQERGGSKKEKRRGENGGKCSRLREMEEIIKSETIVYPSWERYFVKRAE